MDIYVRFDLLVIVKFKLLLTFNQTIVNIIYGIHLSNYLIKHICSL